MGLRIHHFNNLSFWKFAYTQRLDYLVGKNVRYIRLWYYYYIWKYGLVQKVKSHILLVEIWKFGLVRKSKIQISASTNFEIWVVYFSTTSHWKK